MRFGCFIPQGWRLDLVGIEPPDHWDTMLSVARTIEDAGYESLWVYDHFHTVPVPTLEPTYEAWSLMAALAAATDTVRLGQMCTCNSYRPPAYLAKAAATIDVISAGRLEMGIGAGWYEHEYAGYGYPFDKASVRIGRLGEAVEIMRRMWTEDEVTFDGKHYRLDGAISRPHPVQQPHIPFWIAGGGEQLTLRIAARYAAYTNFGMSLDAFTHKSDVLARHCEEAGTDYDAIVRSSNFFVVCEESAGDVEDRIAWIKDRIGSATGDPAQGERLGEMYRPMAGTPDELVDRLRRWGDAGMGYAIVYFAEAATDRAGIERFAAEVIPALA